MKNTIQRNHAIAEKLEQVYRCAVEVSGTALELTIRFSHMPIALEHLDRDERASAVMWHLVPSVFRVTDGDDFAVNILVRKLP